MWCFSFPRLVIGGDLLVTHFTVVLFDPCLCDCDFSGFLLLCLDDHYSWPVRVTASSRLERFICSSKYYEEFLDLVQFTNLSRSLHYFHFLLLIVSCGVLSCLSS